MTLIRLAEKFAICIAAASAVALVFMPLAWARAQSPWPVAAAVFSLGAAAGVVWGFSRRPTAMAAAIEADRQLGLADLLTTALSLNNRADEYSADECFHDRRSVDATSIDDALDPAAVHAVLARAEDAAGRLSPTSLVFARFAPRNWAAVIVAVSTALTVATLLSELMPDRSGVGGAGVPSLADASGAAATANIADPGAARNDATLTNAADGPLPDRPASSRSPEDEQTRSRIGADDSTSTAGGSPSAPGKPGGAGAGGAGAGGSGLGRTKTAGDAARLAELGDSGSPDQSHELPAAPKQSAGAANHRPGGAGDGGAGDGALNSDASASDAAASSDDSAAAAASASSSSASAPAWQSSENADDQGVGNSHGSIEKVPDAYRDLVRSYFNRADDRPRDGASSHF